MPTLEQRQNSLLRSTLDIARQAVYKAFCGLFSGALYIVDQTAYHEVLANIEKCEDSSGKNPGEIELIVVSKTFQADKILPVLKDGARRFGENRVQEAMGKWPELKKQYDDVELHMIGPLQSNKAGDAVELFDVIHTIDRDKIAAAIAKEMQKQGKKLKLFVQVNTGGEKQKAGISPEEAVEFVARCRSKFGLQITGLMCIPPFDENPGPHFALLRKLGAQCDCENLSMGMSADFKTAIEFGATHVRVGSAIFGERG
ncbi:MAG: YggS family pyridoxal phosphate-dependent enzyme [bacterium]|nr:YggS family pyridoxal phosphate-dependent enzyme [bacterium]